MNRRVIDPKTVLKPPPDFLRGVQAPCYAPENELRDWTNDDPLIRNAAAKKCADCPVIAACYAHGKEHREFGVWGGVDLGGGL